ncbi:hypothetical protein PHLCEN_2v12459 [Hermanssonia centrifuga]|uniref:Uncharacterized protein n=1 Tax=Hermanssonia centrifuga TaxID=98765 RepID=A0A2R6NGV4_9APHY|nr:hypothetical protein PHLCEN_2v12459 [Hermanssonia centrifuga]
MGGSLVSNRGTGVRPRWQTHAGAEASHSSAWMYPSLCKAICSPFCAVEGVWLREAGFGVLGWIFKDFGHY